MTIALQAWTPRQDLAILKWTRPELIGTKLLPTVTLDKKQDVLVYTPVRNNSLTPQTGRAMGGAFNVNTIDNVRQPIDLTAAEIAFTDQKDLSDVTEMGDLENSMRQLAYNGKPAVAYALETKIAKAFLDGKTTIPTATSADFITTVRERRQYIASQLGDGKIVVAMSQSVYNTLVMDAEIQKQIGKNVSLPVTQGMSAANIQRIQLAAIFGVDDVLIGQNRSWASNTITNVNAVVVACIPEPNQDTRFSVQLGRTACFVQYVSEPTPADGDMGKDDYDAALEWFGPMGNRKAATPFTCSQWTNGASGSVALTVQTFSLPYIFPENTALFDVVMLPGSSASV